MASPFSTGAVHIYVGVDTDDALNDDRPPPPLRFGGVAPPPSGPAIFPPEPPAHAAREEPPRPAPEVIGRVRKLVYLGTGERAPRVRVRRKFVPWHSDAGGSQTSHDDFFDGEDALVSVALTRWNENVYFAIASLPRTATPAFVDYRGDIGTMMAAEGVTYQLVLRFPHADFKPQMRNRGLRFGYNFYAASLVDDDELEPGTGPNKRHLLWHCRRLYDGGSDTFRLGDFNVRRLVPALAPD